jgi:ADP-ribose pyrophosphatase
MTDHRSGWIVTGHSEPYAVGRLMVHRDEVVTPDGLDRSYVWVAARDQVRVAALVEGKLVFVEQDHYLIGRTLQLPGGTLNERESPEEAGRRELSEETGLHGGVWQSLGHLCPLPGLTPLGVHLFLAIDAVTGPVVLEPGEGDIAVHRLPPLEAIEAIRAGRIACAASVALVYAALAQP